MIDRRDTPGDFSEWLLEPFRPEGEQVSPLLFTSPSERVSQLLGPDGEPLTVGYQRPAVGFDLRPRAKKAGT